MLRVRVHCATWKGQVILDNVVSILFEPVHNDQAAWAVLPTLLVKLRLPEMFVVLLDNRDIADEETIHTLVRLQLG